MRGFIRSLWGDVSNLRNGKIAKEISSVKKKDWFTVYVFGKENEKWLKEIGYRTVLVHEDPCVWDFETRMYRHKLEAFRAAADDFDEFVFLDWDCVPVKELGSTWDDLNKKESFQANLFQYRTKKCLWRDKDTRKVCNGGFIYIRDKLIPDKLISNYDSLCSWVEEQKKSRESRGLSLRLREKSLIFDDEPSMSKYIDDYCGGWQGEEHYWKHFEPSVCNLRKKSVFSKERTESKDCKFVHNL